MLSKKQADAAADAIMAQHQSRHGRAKARDLTGIGTGAVIGCTAGLVATAVSGASYPGVAFAIGGSVVGYVVVRIVRNLARHEAVARE
jgi:hypothetical protein